MDLLSSLSLRGQPNWLQATVSTILQNLIQTLKDYCHSYKSLVITLTFSSFVTRRNIRLANALVSVYMGTAS